MSKKCYVPYSVVDYEGSEEENTKWCCKCTKGPELDWKNFPVLCCQGLYYRYSVYYRVLHMFTYERM